MQLLMTYSHKRNQNTEHLAHQLPHWDQNRPSLHYLHGFLPSLVYIILNNRGNRQAVIKLQHLPDPFLLFCSVKQVKLSFLFF